MVQRRSLLVVLLIVLAVTCAATHPHRGTSQQLQSPRHETLRRVVLPTLGPMSRASQMGEVGGHGGAHPLTSESLGRLGFEVYDLPADVAEDAVRSIPEAHYDPVVTTARLSDPSTPSPPSPPVPPSPTGREIMRVGQAQQRVGVGARSVKIAVLDTGVSENSELAGRVVSGVSWHPQDYYWNDSTQNWAGWDWTDVTDDNGHGTEAATLAAGSTLGVCGNCTVVGFRVLDKDGGGHASDVAAGIVRAVEDFDVDVISLSLGSVFTTPSLDAALEFAAARDVVVVAAAGNDKGSETLFHPGAHDTAIGVVGSTAEGGIYPWSSQPPTADVAAPGCNPSRNHEGDTTYFCGTSSATPLVAGAAALRLSGPVAPLETRRGLAAKMAESPFSATGTSTSDTTRVWPRADALHLVRSWQHSGPFMDVAPHHVFAPAVRWAKTANLTTGYDDSSVFNGASPVERQALVAFLWRAAGSPPPATPASFSDVPLSHPFHDAIAWAEANMIVTGWPDGTFRPALPVERQAAVTFLWRQAGSPPPAGIPPFADVATTHPFVAAISWAVETGLVSGWDDGTFRSTAATERQAVVVWLWRQAEMPPS